MKLNWRPIDSNWLEDLTKDLVYNVWIVFIHEDGEREVALASVGEIGDEDGKPVYIAHNMWGDQTYYKITHWAFYDPPHLP